MPTDIQIEIKGLKEAQKKVEQVIRDLEGDGLLNAMRKATLYVQRDAKRLAPVDTGRLRASITPEIRTSAGGKRLMGVVGSNVMYAPVQERRRRYLQGALTKNAAKIEKLLEDAVGWIVEQ